MENNYFIIHSPIQLLLLAILLLLGCRGGDASSLFLLDTPYSLHRHRRRRTSQYYVSMIIRNGEHNHSISHGIRWSRFYQHSRHRYHNRNSRSIFHGGSHHHSWMVLTANNIDSSDSSDTIDNNHHESTDTKKLSQAELLLELENIFDYQGRISSKMSHPDVFDRNINDMANETTIPNIEHRCALITILGMPNMGKSTLLNALLSESLAIVTSRPQTTRHSILGVLTTPYTQLCITDTPGIIDVPAYKLQMGMMEVVKGAVRDADLFLVVTDVYSGGGDDGIVRNTDDNGNSDDHNNNADNMDSGGNGLGIGEDMLSKLRISGKPVIVCVNKVDLASGNNGSKKDSSNNNTNNNDSNYNNTPTRAVQTIQKWRSALPNAFAILPTCAAHGPTDPGVVALRSILLANDPTVDVGSAIRNLGRPVPGMFASSSTMISNEEEVREILPLGPPLYHPDFFTDRTDRFCASELIRETLFQSLGKELPYCCEVRVETFDESRRYIDEEDDVINDTRHSSSSSSSKKNAMIRIGATILVERDSQKGIVVGKGGTKIKDVGVAARKKLEEFYGIKVFLDLRVKVDKNWRNDAEKLKKYGYM